MDATALTIVGLTVLCLLVMVIFAYYPDEEPPPEEDVQWPYM
jgi:hypothetical protein